MKQRADMTEREKEINTILTMVKHILSEAQLTITTRERVQLIVEDNMTGEVYVFKGDEK